MAYYLGFVRFFPVGSGQTHPDLPVSLVICSRNGLPNLKKNLSYWLSQSYPVFEVLIVDDASTDDTDAFLEQQKAVFSHLRSIRIHPDEKTKPGKKAALAIGIASAAHPVILLTDADCIPATDDWIKNMVAPICEQAHVVIGFSPVLPGISISSHFAAMESIFTAMQYGSAALAGRTYMAVGRNMAYRKELFENANGFNAHTQVISGDDDLFIQSLPGNTVYAVCHEKSSHTYSQAPESLSAFVRQKSRHISTSTSYKLQDQLRLMSFAASHIIWWLTIGTGLYFSFSWPVIFLLIRWLIILPAWKKWSDFLGMEKLFIFFPLFDLLLFPYYLIMGFSLFSKKRSW
jgi:cellulose synthase/poly-beta-1,6-N-acetylglucosamine synthase-like glycosyltransferase